MKEDLKWLAILLLGVLAGVSMMCAVVNKRMAREAERRAVADTVRIVIHDTLTITQPVPATVVQLPDVVKRLPRWSTRANKNAQSDSGLSAAVNISTNECAYPDSALDSVAVIVPMERKVYTDSSTYRAVISGAWTSLDTMQVYARREVVTIKPPPDRRRWSLAVMAGYGWAGKWTPFVGVGFSYNLIQF